MNDQKDDTPTPMKSDAELEAEEISWEESLRDFELPKWLADNVPTPRPQGTISYDEATEKYLYTDPQGNVKEFPGTEEAYDYVQNETTDDFRFSGNLPDTESLMGTSRTSKESKRGGFRMFITSTDTTQLSLLKSRYKSFLELASQYLLNKEDFWLSYNFVKSHPSMWVKEGHSRFVDENDRLAPTFSWNTNEADIWCEPMMGDDGVIRWALEAGAHVPDEYTIRYHDLRLDVWGNTIEDAYIQLAAKLDKFFHLDGTERENVEYEKSKLEIILEERMLEIQENYDAEKEPEDTDGKK